MKNQREELQREERLLAQQPRLLLLQQQQKRRPSWPSPLCFPAGKREGSRRERKRAPLFFSFLLRLSPRFFVILCERASESESRGSHSLDHSLGFFSLSLLCFRTKDHDDAPLPLRDDDDEGDSVFLPVLVADQRRRHGEQQARAKSSSGDGLVVEGNAETGDERCRCAPPLPLVFFPSSCRLDAENQ
jgi:hypothetical protein